MPRIAPLSMIFMAISALLSMGLPVLLVMLARKRYLIRLAPLFTGAAAFIIFALVLESSIHAVVFRHFALRDKPLLYIIYGTLMAGIFEETARFLSFTLLKKRRYGGIETGIMYGIGHGGAEAVLLSGLSMLIGLAMSVLYNTGNLELVTGNLGAEMAHKIAGQVSVMEATSPPLFLMSGIERIFAICIQLGLSIIVFYAVFTSGSLKCYPCAILLHAVVNIPAAAWQVGVLKNLLVVEMFTGLSAALILYGAKTLHERLQGMLIDEADSNAA